MCSTAQLLSSTAVHRSLLLCFGGKGVYRVIILSFFNDCAYVVAAWNSCLSLWALFDCGSMYS